MKMNTQHCTSRSRILSGKRAKPLPPAMVSQLLEQQEKLRRVVDEWRVRSHTLIGELSGDPLATPSFALAASASDPIRLCVEPIERSPLSAILQSENVAVSKFVTVFSYDCIEISNLSCLASKNLYRQLYLFGHRSSLQEVLLEGEPQKAFGESMSLFMELYETTTRMADLLENLLLQLNSVYSVRDKNIRPLNSIKNLMLSTAFEALGEGLAVFLVLDDIIKHNEHIKSYLSLFSRMFNKVKLETHTFDITVEDLDLLNQAVVRIEKLLGVGFFQWLLYKESCKATIEQVKGNKRFIEGCFSCIHEGLLEVLSRHDTWKELPLDRWKILQCMALFIFSTHIFAVTSEKKLTKVLSDMLHLAPFIYIRGKRIILMDVLTEQCPSITSWPLIRESIKVRSVTNNNLLKRLSEIQSRDWHAIKDALTSWITSFHSSVHPCAAMLSEGWLRHHLKKTLQGIVLAGRLQTLILSILDLHAFLEVPIKKEKLKSLCHMIISLKILEQTFQSKAPDMIRSLPHIINIIQADIEQFMLPLKDKLQVEADKGSQMSKLGILSSLTRGTKEVDTRITDSLSLVHISLQMLQGGGSHKRQLIFLNVLDVLQSISYLNIDYSRVRKLTSKLEIVVNFQTIISNVTDCSFLYWRREMMGNLFSMVYADAGRFPWLQYLVDAFSDGLGLLKLGQVGKRTLESYQNEIECGLKNEIVAPLCRDLETDLRLHVHSTYLKGSVVVNPTKTGVRDLAWYLELKPLRLPLKFIDISLLVESYLNSAFYNHSTMSTYDRKIYLEMQLLAELKYGLPLGDVYFSRNSMAHNIDIDEIVQDFHAFAENYSYSIVNQVFIEKVTKAPNKKNLRLIGIEDIEHSISVHGLKKIHKASDLILKFLNQMFTTLSQLLQNRYSGSNSTKEYIFLTTDKEVVDRIPYLQQAEPRFALGKLMLGDYEVSFLEQLHLVMTRIGNALGLVRILQGGSSRHSCGISRFSIGMSFVESCQMLGFVDEVLAAGRMMDKAIKEDCEPDARQISISSFINMFINEYQLSKDDPTKDFFQIVPSAIVYVVNSRVSHKDKLLLKELDSEITLYMHDSFFMGVAFALKVLGQERSFEELNCFASARKSLEEKMSSLESSIKIQDNSKVSSLGRFKVWSQASSIPVEIQKDLDECKRYLKEIELVEDVYTIAWTMMS